VALLALAELNVVSVCPSDTSHRELELCSVQFRDFGFGDIVRESYTEN
jgi:hypothetical protein